MSEGGNPDAGSIALIVRNPAHLDCLDRCGRVVTEIQAELVKLPQMIGDVFADIASRCRWSAQ